MVYRIAASLMTLFILAFALLGLAMAVNHFIAPPYNDGFARHPLIVKAHVVLGAFYLFVGAFQFAPWIRNRWIGYHRAAGRLLAAAALAVGATAIFIGLVIPFSGLAEQIVMCVFGGFFLISIITAVTYVRAGRVDRHREWMIRAYAIGAGVVTMRLIFIPLLIITGASTYELTAALSIVSFTAAFVLHAGIAEVWIRMTRGRVVV